MVVKHRPRRSRGVRRGVALAAVASAALWTSTAAAAPALSPSGLKTNALSAAAGHRRRHAGLQLEAQRAPAAPPLQSAYEIRVAATEAQLAVGPVPVAVGQGRVRQGVRRRLRRRPAAVAPARRLAGPRLGRQRRGVGVERARRSSRPGCSSSPTGARRSGSSSPGARPPSRCRSSPVASRSTSRVAQRAPVHERPRPLRRADQRRQAHRRGARARATRTTSSPPSTAPTTSRASCAAARTRSASSSARAPPTTSRWPTRPPARDELVRVVEQLRGRQRHADRCRPPRVTPTSRSRSVAQLLRRRHDQRRHRRRRRAASSRARSPRSARAPTSTALALPGRGRRHERQGQQRRRPGRRRHAAHRSAAAAPPSPPSAPPRSQTTLVAPVTAGATNVKLASTTGIVAGNTLVGRRRDPHGDRGRHAGSRDDARRRGRRRRDERARGQRHRPGRTQHDHRRRAVRAGHGRRHAGRGRHRPHPGRAARRGRRQRRRRALRRHGRHLHARAGARRTRPAPRSSTPAPA